MKLLPLALFGALAFLAASILPADAKALNCNGGNGNGNCPTASNQYVDANGNAIDVDATHPLPVTAAALPASSAVIGTVNSASQYPVGAVPVTISATGTTAATAATLAASVTLKTYVCGFAIRANATAAATGNSTVAGTVTGTLNFSQWTAPLATGIGLTEERFAPCIPSSAINTAIVVTSAAPGTAGVVSVSAWGYQAP